MRGILPSSVDGWHIFDLVPFEDLFKQEADTKRMLRFSLKYKYGKVWYGTLAPEDETMTSGYLNGHTTINDICASLALLVRSIDTCLQCRERRFQSWLC